MTLRCELPPHIWIEQSQDQHGGAHRVQEGVGTQDIIFRLTETTSVDVTITWEIQRRVSSDLATSGDDFVAPTSRTVTIPAGQTQAVVTFQIVDDTISEPEEHFSVVVTDATNATYGGDTYRSVIILDNDTP